MQLKCVYFSPTERTKTVVREIADRLVRAQPNLFENVVYCDITPKPRRNSALSFEPSDYVIFGLPVYAGRVPNVLLSFLETMTGNSAAAVAVVTYGNRHFDDALIELSDLLRRKNFNVIGAGAFIGQHSFSKTLAAGRPDQQDLLALDAFALDLLAKGQVPLVIESIEGSLPVRPYYRPRNAAGEPMPFKGIKPVIDTTACTACGICAARCPMGSLTVEGHASVTGACIKCCSCVVHCPVNAVRFDDPYFEEHRLDLEKTYAKRKDPVWFL
ncbi:4Fe-4S binding protein [Fusibacter paucivorans]|uniref:4Fe-4S binding protein n=1 Tax=Fusibacter paucivorans TaxID=76009 RepID=A0ABS5PL72_9FIRM|nr:4Fe-4S binding protein [Fusibacter paucivorans]MBS7525066.1 4Fe-4S binding protein [Fusibacter paucivorans]